MDSTTISQLIELAEIGVLSLLVLLVLYLVIDSIIYHWPEWHEQEPGSWTRLTERRFDDGLQ